MAKKKNNKPPQPIKQKNGSSTPLGFIKEALTLIGGLAGSILAVYGLVKTFKDDTEGFSWLIPLGVVIWVMVLWRLFQIRKTTAYSLLIISILAGVVGWIGWQSQIKAIEDNVVVLVAQFDGPEETYGLHNQMVEDLREATKGFNDVIIIDGKEIVTAGDGSEYARELGMKVKADLVFWAWYRPTENPNVTIHIENLYPTDIKIISASEVYRPQATLANLETFELQRKLGSETSSFVSFLSGLLHYEAHNYSIALAHFRQALLADNLSTYIDQKILYFFMGNLQDTVGELEDAIVSYNKVIEFDPNFSMAYANRGLAYAKLLQYENASKDYEKAINLSPKDVVAYNNRGVLYVTLLDYPRAIDDFSKVIELDPNAAYAYYNRGSISDALGQYEHAIEDFSAAIDIDPNMTAAYGNRGISYRNLGNYERALEDYERAIKIDPEDSIAYSNRGYVYGILGNYELALNDLDKAIELNPKDAAAYNNRGLAYQALGKTAEAEADFKKYEELTGQKP
jgi:tetratricopeptide (TPR) repeat protein